MSHFAVAVISENPGDVERLLAPYQENNMGDCPEEYMQFFSVEEEYREKYETGFDKKIRAPDGRLIEPYDEELRVPGTIGIGGDTHKAPKNMGYIEVLTAYKDIYDTFDDFMKQHCDIERDDQGRYGYYENPEAKWDYWRVGGRYRGLIKASKGLLDELSWEHTLGGKEHVDPPGMFDIAQIKDIDLSIDEDVYKHSLRFWEVNVEGRPLAEGENPDDFLCYWRPEYYLERYPNKEMYAKTQASFSAWALVTPDGQWHEQGEMGWWASNNATKDSIENYHNLFEKALRETDPEYYVTIVDCHI